MSNDLVIHSPLVSPPPSFLVADVVGKIGGAAGNRIFGKAAPLRPTALLKTNVNRREGFRFKAPWRQYSRSDRRSLLFSLTHMSPSLNKGETQRVFRGFCGNLFDRADFEHKASIHLL